MPEVALCPSCGRRLTLPEAMRGHEVRCPSCQGTFSAGLPASATSEQVQAAPNPDAVSARRSPEPWPEPPDEDDRPWERSGFVRRDCEPHRAGMVLTFGIISLCCLIGFLCGGIILNPVGMGLGIAAWVMGSRDIRKMRDGQMDPAGIGQTRSGRTCGMIGTVLNSLCTVGQVGLFVYMLTSKM